MIELELTRSRSSIAVSICCVYYINIGHWADTNCHSYISVESDSNYRSYSSENDYNPPYCELCQLRFCYYPDYFHMFPENNAFMGNGNDNYLYRSRSLHCSAANNCRSCVWRSIGPLDVIDAHQAHLDIEYFSAQTDCYLKHIWFWTPVCAGFLLSYEGGCTDFTEYRACVSSTIRSILIGRSFSNIKDVDISCKRFQSPNLNLNNHISNTINEGDLPPSLCACHIEALFGMITACAPAIKAAHNTLTHGNSRTSSKNSRKKGGLDNSVTLASPRGVPDLELPNDGQSLGRCSSSERSQNHALHDLESHSGTSTLHLNPQLTEEAENDVPLQSLKPYIGGIF